MMVRLIALFAQKAIVVAIGEDTLEDKEDDEGATDEEHKQHADKRHLMRVTK